MPILIRPEELGVDLLRLYQVFQLFQARKRPVFKHIFGHVNPLEQIIELFRSTADVPSASELRQMLANLLKAHTVTPIILAGLQNSHDSQETPRRPSLRSRECDSCEKYRQH